MNQTVLLVLQLVLLGVIFYFFMIRPENKRRKAIATMQSIFERNAISRKVEK